MRNVLKQPSAATRHTIRWQGTPSILDRDWGASRDIGTIAMIGNKETAR